jgi:hypothetical protein
LTTSAFLTLGHIGGRGRTSGLDVAHESAGLFHVRDGKVTRLVIYMDRERALADLGLAPEADATDESRLIWRGVCQGAALIGRRVWLGGWHGGGGGSRGATS